jgi:hypothetical protein
VKKDSSGIQLRGLAKTLLVELSIVFAGLKQFQPLKLVCEENSFGKYNVEETIICIWFCFLYSFIDEEMDIWF